MPVILFTFSKARVPIDWVVKLKPSEQTLHEVWIHVLFILPRTQAIFLHQIEIFVTREISGPRKEIEGLRFYVYEKQTLK